MQCGTVERLFHIAYFSAWGTTLFFLIIFNMLRWKEHKAREFSKAAAHAYQVLKAPPKKNP